MEEMVVVVVVVVEVEVEMEWRNRWSWRWSALTAGGCETSSMRGCGSGVSAAAAQHANRVVIAIHSS